MHHRTLLQLPLALLSFAGVAVHCGGPTAEPVPPASADASPGEDTGAADVVTKGDATASDAAQDARDAAALSEADEVRAGAAHFDLWGMIHTGQSLSVGSSGGTPDPSPQLYSNVMLFDATGKYDDSGQLSLVPLRSPVRSFAYTPHYPANIGGESPAEAMANQLSARTAALIGKALRSAPSLVGQGGRPISVIQKQPGAQYPAANPTPTVSTAYWASLYETTQLQTLAKAENARFGVGAIVFTHGENDALLSGQTEQSYADAVYALAREYNTDLKAITQQSQAIPLLLTQQHIVPGGADVKSRMTLAQRLVAQQHPAEVTLVGPKYQYEYAADAIHLVAPAYARLGEKYAEIFEYVRLRGRAFAPLEPIAISRAGTALKVKFHVPYLPLAFETAFPVFPVAGHPWAAGRGFEVRNADGSKVEIVSAVVGSGTENDTVILQLAALPSANCVVGYAMTQAANTTGANYAGGKNIGRHGNLHDSDPFVARDKATIAAIASGTLVATPAAFARVTTHDRVTFDAFAGEWTVVARSVDTLTLDRPVPMNANVTATIVSDQRNYAIGFEEVVP
jgi:hypothetical protein